MLGADNQQERLDTSWIAGFVDGEGCFYIGINKIENMTLGWQVLPEFRVVQHASDEQILQRIRTYFQFGDIRVNHGDRKEFRVRGMKNLNEIVKFFRNSPLQTKKRKDFELFSKVIEMMNRKEHLTENGIRQIAEIASKMNHKIQPKYLKSSETKRQTPARVKI